MTWAAVGVAGTVRAAVAGIVGGSGDSGNVNAISSMEVGAGAMCHSSLVPCPPPSYHHFCFIYYLNVFTFLCTYLYYFKHV